MSIDPSRIGVVLGTSGAGYTWSDPGCDSQRILKNMVNAPASWISLNKKIQGPSFVVSTACSSGTYAMSIAHALITSGQCDVVISGSGDSSINYPDVEGFCSLMALSEKNGDCCTASKPFDKDRTGFVIGEGAGILVLESAAFAKKRNADIYAELHLPGLISETYNILSPEPKGLGMARAMDLALKNARLDPTAIDYINAHGTGTCLNDLYETQAIKRVFEKNAFSIPISSTKSMTGHCLGGASGVEAVICCKAMAENTIPPTANLARPDPELDLDFVPHTPRKKELTHVMSNSFAFGGHNGVCIFSKFKER
jgi:3-oxoacyl-[acyl-carrier-protein] synthase II